MSLEHEEQLLVDQPTEAKYDHQKYMAFFSICLFFLAFIYLFMCDKFVIMIQDFADSIYKRFFVVIKSARNLQKATNWIRPSNSRVRLRHLF